MFNVLVVILVLVFGVLGLVLDWQHSVAVIFWLSVLALAMPSLADEIQDWQRKRRRKR